MELTFSGTISLQDVLFGVMIGMSAMTYFTINAVRIGNEFDINPTSSFGTQNCNDEIQELNNTLWKHNNLISKHALDHM